MDLKGSSLSDLVISKSFTMYKSVISKLTCTSFKASVYNTPLHAKIKSKSWQHVYWMLLRPSPSSRPPSLDHQHTNPPPSLHTTTPRPTTHHPLKGHLVLSNFHSIGNKTKQNRKQPINCIGNSWKYQWLQTSWRKPFTLYISWLSMDLNT